MRVFRYWPVFVLFFFIPVSALASEPLQSQLYQEALKHLRENNQSLYQLKKQQLLSSPLYPYLKYHEITQVFELSDQEAVHNFLHKYSNLNIARKLKQRWIRLLVQHKKWSAISTLTANEKRPSCLAMLANYQINGTLEPPQLKQKWRNPYHSRYCKSIFKHWHAEMGIPDELLWPRFSKLMNQNKIKKAKSLLSLMNPELSAKAKFWLKVHYRPGLVRTSNIKNTSYGRDILVYGLRRLASRNPSAAARHLEQNTEKYSFTDEDRYRVYSKIAARLATRQQPSAEKWFAKIPVDKMTPSLRSWYMRSAIAHKKWSAFIERYEQLPLNEQAFASWRFWKAYGLYQLNEKTKANVIFESLLKERHYYALLASHILNRPFELHHQVPHYTSRELLVVARNSHIQRAKLFFQDKQYTLASSEWNHALSQLTSKQNYLAAVLATQWGWHSKAIFTLSEHPNQDDMKLRFPLAYHDKIQKVAKKTQLNPATIFAISRLESTFNGNALSPAGAVGMMQLMPSTAKRYKKRLRLKSLRNRDLYHIPTNLLIGCTHYAGLVKHLKGDAVAAIAAYNAGLHNVKRWLKRRSIREDHIWIELIPFKETREYVKRVIVYSAIYHQHLKKEFQLEHYFSNPLP